MTKRVRLVLTFGNTEHFVVDDFFLGKDIRTVKQDILLHCPIDDRDQESDFTFHHGFVKPRLLTQTFLDRRDKQAEELTIYVDRNSPVEVRFLW